VSLEPLSSEPRRLSSALTFGARFVFPAVWIGGFTAATLTLFFFPQAWHGESGGPPGPGLKWIFLCATAGGAAFIWWACGPLKRVRLDATALYISNYFTEIVVPLSQVAEVTEDYFVSGHPVTIRFHRATEFGSSVKFIPRARWSGFQVSHPAIDEIRQAMSRVHS